MTLLIQDSKERLEQSLRADTNQDPIEYQKTVSKTNAQTALGQVALITH